MSKNKVAKQKKGAEETKKVRICKAALDCYLTLGPVQTSLSAVARRAKVPHPLILYYFPTMDALFREAVQSVLESLKEATLKAIEKHIFDPKRMLTAYVKAPFDWGIENPGYLNLWIYFYHFTQWSEDLMDLNTSIRKLGRDRISSMLFEGAARKVFDFSSLDSVPEMAFQIQSLISGAVIQAFTEKGVDPNQIRDDTAAQVLEWVNCK